MRSRRPSIDVSLRPIELLAAPRMPLLAAPSRPWTPMSGGGRRRLALRSATVSLCGRRWNGGNLSDRMYSSRDMPAARAAAPCKASSTRPSRGRRRVGDEKMRCMGATRRRHRLGGSPSTHSSHPSRSSSLPNTSSAASTPLRRSSVSSSHSSPLPPAAVPARSDWALCLSALGPGMGVKCAAPPSASMTASSSGRTSGSASRANSS